MNKKDFLAQYQTKEWFELSKRIKARDNNTCQMCGCNNKPISVHHLCYRDGNILNNDDEELITLCEDCHKKQKESREHVFELLNDLRTVYTDYEIETMLDTIYQSSVSDVPVYWRTLEPSKDFQNLFTNCVDSRKAINLNNWRKKIRYEKYKKEAIREFRIFDDEEERNDISLWFRRVYNEDISDYLEK